MQESGMHGMQALCLFWTRCALFFTSFRKHNGDDGVTGDSNAHGGLAAAGTLGAEAQKVVETFYEIQSQQFTLAPACPVHQ